MARVAEKPEKILLGIQGLCGKIREVYMAGLPLAVINSRSFRDIVKRDSLLEQQEKFAQRAEHERELFSLVQHITGRNAFDRATTKELNPAATYHYLNEFMRPDFYQSEWNAEKCEPFSLFQTQGDYPLKGLHHTLAALPLLRERFPQAHLYVAGADIIGKPSFKLSAYAKYLKALIAEHRLEGSVTMLGKLDEKLLKQRLLDSSVAVCPSALEGSCNSVAEAQILGVPVVAAAVGGIPDLIDDGETGFLYETGDIAALAAAIEKAWEAKTAGRISKKAASEAAKRHDRKANFARLVEIYREIIGS
jgi:glycosyltransferase involved in cell wall biosynthesis